MVEVKERIPRMLISARLAITAVKKVIEKIEPSRTAGYTMADGPIELSNGDILRSAQINHGNGYGTECSIIISLELPNKS